MDTLYTVTAHVGLGRERAEIEEFARIAHAEVCPHPRATRGNIDVTLRVA